MRVTKNTGVTKYYVDSSKDWRGFLIPIGVAKYGGTVANANTGQWDGIWGRPANNTDVEMVGASKTSNATLWAGTISSATVNLNIDYTGGADNGHLYLTVSGFGSEFQVRFLIGWPSMTAKSGPDVTI